jgi:hypothetical protein
LKITSTKHNKYVVDKKKKLKHVDDISFRELFGRIREVKCFNAIAGREGLRLYVL